MPSRRLARRVLDAPSMLLEPAALWKVADAETVPDEAVRAREARRILVVIFGALLAQQALLSFLGLLLHRDINYWPGAPFGDDFLVFYRTSRDILAGASQYAVVDPPLASLVAVPFLPFGQQAATYAFFVANLAMVLTALALTARRFAFRSATEVALLAGIFGLYCPSYFLLQRGNIDGVVMLCVALAIWSVGRAWASAFVVLGVSLKIYPAVMLAYFTMARRWRALWVAAVTALICVAVVWPLWPAYGHMLMSRSARWEVAENSSLFNFALGLMSVLRLPRVCGLVLASAAAIGLFALQALADRRAPAQSTRAQAARLALYIPFFAAAPPVVYPYTQVSFLLLLPVFWWMARTGVASRSAQLGFVIGFLLTATHASVWTDLTGRAGFDLLPATGTLLVLTACTEAKREWELRQAHARSVRAVGSLADGPASDTLHGGLVAAGRAR
jgi:hypothetical protein